ncbi:tudor domain-containing 6 isoform X2 [Cheilinus undulatus]|uniref:tudor domain-containing 6 isoform X2 n=1 Tax=Cheilinus undulatus TaxID=241271 RepID=UPI001BD3A33C|nr:tudor domain-containing 6 isoform X2 [Cheilinus undulatus]
MTSIVGLPTQGSDVTVFIQKVHLHPLCELVEFWGKFSQDRTAEYECLAKEIQSPGNLFQESEGNPGDQCLAQVDGSWFRSRIVSRNGSKYSVFLIDKGVTFSTSSSKLAWGKKKHFHLPPEVEFCVLANALPLSPENKWSRVALEYLRSLCGKSFEAHVQDVLFPHRTLLLQIPCISKQMFEMGIAKKLSPDLFQNFVFMSLQSKSVAEVPQRTGLTLNGEDERLHKQEAFLYPELQAGTVETVIVTDVTNPQRIFCQLKVFSQELRKLSDKITQCCEGRMKSCLIGPEMVGFPCAARGRDGKWYRSVLQQIIPTNQVVEVLNIDYGIKQFVQVENVRPLATEFFRMPVVTFVCSLHGIVDNGLGWTTSQIDYLKTLLLNKTVIAKFEYQSISEGVYYVTLYGDENTNLNKLFGSNMSCSQESEKTLKDYAIHNTTYRRQPCQEEGYQKRMLVEGKEVLKKLLAEDLSLNSSHVAVVQQAVDPSEFWIQTQNYANELDELMDQIYHLYKDSVDKDKVKNPEVGLYCAAKAEDGDFYRATVTEVGETQVKVFFVDYGNTEMVDRNDIRMLPDKFKKLPRLALKCTLAGVMPKGQTWSQSASEFFIKAVKDRELNVDVKEKYDDCYAVQLTDLEAQGERDLASQMWSSGHAEKAETKRPLKAQMPMQAAVLSAAGLRDSRLSSAHNNSGSPFQTLNAVDLAKNLGRTPTFKEQMFSPGSILDASVSYIESPNDFWCQLVQNAGLLKFLMHDIQAYYEGSEFQPLMEIPCVARHPDNKMWYRALVIHKHETPHVDVLFVDYGQTETVPVHDLRRICPQFLTLPGQAFRCRLLNPFDPTSNTNEWNKEAVEMFHNFVETAASNFVILKCTIYAVMFSEQKVVFNIVDLETPFESISASMASLLKSAPPKKAAKPSFRLDTYYYSTHNVKTGTEEQVTVTCVNNVSQFYCQLERNADVMNDLNIKVNNLCQQLENVKLPAVFGTLCFARYTDGQWYRGQIKATKPVILVHFVDYGDTIEVGKSDLLPVPREANDIMSMPVQALVCSLSDVPANVPGKVSSWFETSVTECKFRALVVAREPDGKLLVELYQGSTQINSKIKKMFQIEMQHSETMVVHQGWKAPDTSANQTLKSLEAAPKPAEETKIQTHRNDHSASKPAPKLRDSNNNLKSEPKPPCSLCKNGQKVKAAPLKLYQPPHQRKASGRADANEENRSEPAAVPVKMKKTSLPIETKQLSKSTSHATEPQKESNVGKLPKLADLPSKSITSGMEADIYVSHCNSPLSFYVQLVKEEEEIFSLVEKLNDTKSIPQTDIKDLHPGDLVQAEFAEDSSWYRAVVKEVHSNTVALVEFVDFGNTAVLPVSKMARLEKSFLQLPMYSTHCMLSHALTFEEEGVLDPEVVSAFKEDVGGNGEKVLMCSFNRQSGSVWEVSLKDSGVNLICKVPSRCSTDGSDINTGKLVQVKDKPAQVKDKPAQNSDIRPAPVVSQMESCSLSYPKQQFSEGEKLDVYIMATNDDQTFWCQSASPEDLDKVTLRVAEVGDSAIHKDIDPASLSPGRPCIALFSEDNLWYRAEVISKEGDVLLVFFVDYGNKSKVTISNVRDIPHDLTEKPPLAFLCELEGLDPSNGSWDSGVADELLALTVDKPLQLSVLQVTREGGKIKYLVQIECEGQVINKALKTYWRAPMTENSPLADELANSDGGLLQCVQYKNSEMDASILTSTPKNGKSPVAFVPTESLVIPEEEERNLISSEGTVTTEPLKLKTTESLMESLSKESKFTSVVVSQTNPPDIFTCSGDKIVIPLETVKGTEEEVAALDNFEADDLHSPLDDSPKEAVVESLNTTAGLESRPQKADTYGIESSLDETMFATEESTGTEEEVATVMGNVEPSDLHSQIDDNPTEAILKTGKTTADLESLSQEADAYGIESSLNETMLSIKTNKGPEEEVAMTEDMFEPDDLHFPLDENPTGAVVESKNTTTDVELLSQEVDTFSIKSSLVETILVIEASKGTEEEVAAMIDVFDPDDLHSPLDGTPSEIVVESGISTTDLDSLPQEADSCAIKNSFGETMLATETNKGTEEEVDAMFDMFEPEDLDSQVAENPTEAIDESGITTTDLDSLPQEADSCAIESSFGETMLASETDKGTEEEVAAVFDMFEPKDLDSQVAENPTEAMVESKNTTDLESLSQEVDTFGIESKCTEEEDISVMETPGPDDLDYMLGTKPTDARDELGITTISEPPPWKAHASIMERSPDTVIFADSNERKGEVSISRDYSANSTTVKMVPREAVWPSKSRDPCEITNSTSDDLKQDQTDSGVPSCVLPVPDADIEQGFAAEGDAPKEKMVCVTTHRKDDFMAEKETKAHQEDKCSDEADKAASVGHTYTSSPQYLDNVVKEVACSVEEACSTNVCTDLIEPCEGEASSERVDYVSCVTAEETVQTGSLVSCTELPLEDSTKVPSEDDVDDTDNYPLDEVLHSKILVTEDETAALQEDPLTDLVADTDKAAIERDTCTASSQDLDDEVKEATCSVEKACLKDIYTELNEPCEGEAFTVRDDCVSCVTAEETVKRESLVCCTESPREQSIEFPSEDEAESGDVSLQDETCSMNISVTEDESMVLQEDELPGFPSDPEPPVCKGSCPDLNNLVEEVTCLVGEICLTDFCRDPSQEPEGSEQLMQTPCTEKEDDSTGVMEKKPSDDSFEDQLLKITHLSLKINDGSADALPAERMSEESDI